LAAPPATSRLGSLMRSAGTSPRTGRSLRGQSAYRGTALAAFCSSPGPTKSGVGCLQHIQRQSFDEHFRLQMFYTICSSALNLRIECSGVNVLIRRLPGSVHVGRELYVNCVPIGRNVLARSLRGCSGRTTNITLAGGCSHFELVHISAHSTGPLERNSGSRKSRKWRWGCYHAKGRGAGQIDVLEGRLPPTGPVSGHLRINGATATRHVTRTLRIGSGRSTDIAPAESSSHIQLIFIGADAHRPQEAYISPRQNGSWWSGVGRHRRRAQ